MLRVGVEHEYRLWRDGRQVDFRELLPQLTPGLRTLDPGDPRARRLPSGVALTADGWEAELATPPLEPVASTPLRIDHLLRSERSELLVVARSCGVDRITGFSTHLNISVRDDAAVALGRAFADHCLAAMGDVLEPAPPSGLFVRPRRGRLEVGAEYAEGHDLRAALTLYVACIDMLAGGSLPPVLRTPGLVPSREKFGWYAATVPPGQLRAVWAWARPAAIARGLDPGPLDELVSGVRPLRRHRDGEATECTVTSEPTASAPATPDVGRRVLPSGVVAETEWLTWDHVVWVFADERGRLCRAVMPVVEEPAFLAHLEAGVHDAVLRRMLRRRISSNLQLSRHTQVRGLLSWWHEVRPSALVPPTRLPDGSLPVERP